MTEAWDGYPENRERDGWHWLEIISPDGIVLVAGLWEIGEWSLPAIGQDQTPEEMARLGGDIRYVGPCLTPAEVEALVHKAVDEAVHNAMLEASTHVA